MLVHREPSAIGLQHEHNRFALVVREGVAGDCQLGFDGMREDRRFANDLAAFFLVGLAWAGFDLATTGLAMARTMP